VSRPAATRTAILVASALAWVALAHLALGVGLLPAAGFIALLSLAAFGVGYEMDDPGTATAMFLGLALAGVLVGVLGAASGAGGMAAVLAFGSAPALIGAQGARAGGLRRERC
jgi:hypothetical protein